MKLRHLYNYREHQFTNIYPISFKGMFYQHEMKTTNFHVVKLEASHEK
jgi:hypothetical protein